MKKFTKILALIIVMILAFNLTACFPKDVESAKQKMQDKGYVVSVNQFEDAENHGIVGGFTAYKLDDNNQKQTVIVIYFNSNSKAQEYAKSWYNSVFITEYSGKCAYSGTQQAIDDLKK